MRRREFLLNLAAAVPGAALAGWSRRAGALEPVVPPGWRVFEVVTSVQVAAPSTPTQLWLPLPSNIQVYKSSLANYAPLNPFSGGLNPEAWYFTK